MTSSDVALHPPPIDLYFFDAHAFAYADGYTANFDLAADLALAHFSGLVGTFFSSICSTSSVATLIGAPRRSGLGSSLRFLLAALARPSLPNACAFH